MKTLMAWSAALAGAAWLAGCASYEARPVDAAAHRAAWLARSPASPEVAALAAQLRESDPAVEFHPDDGISAPEAEIVALLYNADLRLARLRAGVTRADAEHAGRWEDPVLGGNVARFLQSAPHPWMVMTTLGLTLPISGRLAVERELAGAEHGADLARLYEQEWATLNALRMAWVEWSAAAAKLGVMCEYAELLDGLVRTVDELEKAGELAPIEARMFRIEQAMLRNRLIAAESALREGELRIRRIMGISPTAPLELVPGAPAQPPLENAAEDLARFSPAVAVAMAEYEAAERMLKLEVRKQYPDLMAGPGYGREEGMDEAVVMFQVPIPLWNRNQQGIARAEARRELARAVVETTLERIESELASAEVAYRAALAQRETIEREVAPLAQRQFEDARSVAQLGEVDTLLLLQSLSRRQEALMDLVEARRAEHAALVRLHELAGPRPRTETPQEAAQ